MLITCPSCGACFDLPDDRLPGRRMRLKCPVCRGRMQVEKRAVSGRGRATDGDDQRTVWLERLADALVSDILHYHRPRVEAARRSDRILSELSDEIHLAWSDYKSRLERVDTRAREIFSAAVNRILGQGREIL